MAKRLLVLATSLFVLVSSAFAQGNARASDSKEGDDEKPKEVSMKLRIYRWGISNSIVLPDQFGRISNTKASKNSIQDLYYSVGGGAYRRVPLSTSGLGGEFEYKGEPQLEFFTRVPKEKRNDEDKYKSVGKVTLPFNTDHIFLLMIQRGENARFFPMNISPQILPKEKVAVLNMTNQNLGISMGDKNMVLRGGGYGIYDPKREEEDESSEFKIFRYDKDKWRPVYEGNIMASKEKRCMLLVYDPYGKPQYPKFSVQLVYF